MKIASWVLNVLLIGPIVKLLLVATQLYRNHDHLHGYAISNSQVDEFERPYIILSAVYIIAFFVSIILNWRWKYVFNIIVASVAFIYFIAVWAINNI